MKNIHVIPTSQPSRLVKLRNSDKLQLFENAVTFKTFERSPQNIYITNNEEEIKDNDYITDGYLVWKWKDNSSLLGRKKIILTTDQDLIKDGVQAIDDEFLEWFVKNPSCEEVETDEYPRFDLGRGEYKIIIPKQEHKQVITNQLEQKSLEEYQQELFNYVHDLGVIALESELHEVERIVLSMQSKKGKQETIEEEPKIYTQDDYFKDEFTKEEPKQGTMSEAIKQVITNQLKQETLEEKVRQVILSTDTQTASMEIVKLVTKWQMEQIGKSDFLQKLRATVSDAEARRLIFETLKKK